MATDLRDRSIRTLAWLGDAVFERDVRWRVAARGDYPTDRLDAIKAEVVRAEAQAALLRAIEPELTDTEADVARRARNAAPSRPRHHAQTYRLATALEALVAHWAMDSAAGRQRFETVLGPHLEAAIDEAVERKAQRPKRG